MLPDSLFLFVKTNGHCAKVFEKVRNFLKIILSLRLMLLTFDSSIFIFHLAFKFTGKFPGIISERIFRTARTLLFHRRNF